MDDDSGMMKELKMKIG